MKFFKYFEYFILSLIDLFLCLFVFLEWGGCGGGGGGLGYIFFIYIFTCCHIIINFFVQLKMPHFIFGFQRRLGHFEVNGLICIN